ncbi:MAG: TetR/AcrR family transcriptional regulator, partial [Solirubrobacteraceae bacterium]|nr:TetR/AcrR family transcriptional regulator [Solirubrobacteraceae bacterium]
MPEELGLRERKKRETRRRLAETALGLFLERGFDEVSVAEVAEAAGVSKMTVFNHFPAKEDLVFELTSDRGLPDLAAAVRARAPGVSAVAAIRAEARLEFQRQIDADDDFDSQVPAFIRMVFRSPTLLQGFGRRWITVQTALGIALAEETGVPAPRGDLEQEFFAAVRSDTGAETLREVVGAIGGDALPASIVAA